MIVVETECVRKQVVTAIKVTVAWDVRSSCVPTTARTTESASMANVIVIMDGRVQDVLCPSARQIVLVVMEYVLDSIYAHVILLGRVRCVS